MLGFWIGIFLIGTLFVVHLLSRIKLSNPKDPLNIDKSLPFPGFGQGSSIFSLTALFSAYLAILLLLGISAIIGLCIGSIVGLFLIKKRIQFSTASTFEMFIYEVLVPSELGDVILLKIIALNQIFFAISELLILNGVLIQNFNFTFQYSFVSVISIAFITYYYCLYKGYIAVFETDILQFIFIIIMCFSISYCIISNLVNLIDVNNSISIPLISYSNEKYWFLFKQNYPFRIVYHILLGFIMGLSFIISSPDTWKRVFVVVKYRKSKSFYAFLIAGILPFIFLLPITLLPNANPEEYIHLNQFFNIVSEKSPYLIIFIMIGILSCFLSSFDSSLITSTHLLLISKKKYFNSIDKRLPYFRIYLASVFLLIVFLYLLISSLVNNIYLLANFLIIVYAIFSGIILGTYGLMRKVSKENIIWVIVFGFIVWFIYFVISFSGITHEITLEQINSVPIGVLISIIVTILIRIISKDKKC